MRLIVHVRDKNYFKLRNLLHKNLACNLKKQMLIQNNNSIMNTNQINTTLKINKLLLTLRPITNQFRNYCKMKFADQSTVQMM